MTAELVLLIILSIFTLDFILERILDVLNNRTLKTELPESGKDIYNKDEYSQMLSYEKETGRFSLILSVIGFIVTFLLLFYGFFGWFDSIIRQFGFTNQIVVGLLFFGVLGFVSDILTTPFSIYSTFVIEEKFGFNKSSYSTFFADKIKGWLLGGLLGGGMYSVMVLLFNYFGTYFWIFAWLVIAGFSIIMNMFYTSLIMPLFNKLKPLEEGELRQKIQLYCNSVNFPLTNVFVIDGSKRSSKANAFFSGLGKQKKIVLYDTLIEKLSQEEIVAVLAHEVGHYKKKHIVLSTILTMLLMGLMLFLLSLTLNNETLAEAIGASTTSFHISLILFGFLYTPISLITGVLMNILSRKNEFEADDFAKNTYQSVHLQSSLKKLAVDSLSNLTPHKGYVFFHYSHPPLLQRIENLKN